jgi:hypothetical protein
MPICSLVAPCRAGAALRDFGKSSRFQETDPHGRDTARAAANLVPRELGPGLYAVQNFLICLLALGGLFYALRSREPLYLLLLAHIAYFVAFHTAINVQYRFVCPIMAYMILLAGPPVEQLWHRRRPGSFALVPLTHGRVRT